MQCLVTFEQWVLCVRVCVCVCVRTLVWLAGFVWYRRSFLVSQAFWYRSSCLVSQLLSGITGFLVLQVLYGIAAPVWYRRSFLVTQAFLISEALFGIAAPVWYHRSCLVSRVLSGISGFLVSEVLSGSQVLSGIQMCLSKMQPGPLFLLQV